MFDSLISFIASILSLMFGIVGYDVSLTKVGDSYPVKEKTKEVFVQYQNVKDNVKEMSTSSLKQAILKGATVVGSTTDPKVKEKLVGYVEEYSKRVPNDKEIESLLNSTLLNILIR